MKTIVAAFIPFLYGEVNPLSAEEYTQRFNPLKLVVHHHCSPPPTGSGNVEPASADVMQPEPKEIKIDLSKLT